MRSGGRAEPASLGMALGHAAACAPECEVGVAGKRDATRPAESLGWSRMGSDALVFRATLANHAFLLTSITQTCIARLQHVVLGSAYRSTYLLRVLQPTACHGRLTARHRGRSSDAPCSFCASGAHTLAHAASTAGDKLVDETACPCTLRFAQIQQ